jgi:hypothetical protein
MNEEKVSGSVQRKKKGPFAEKAQSAVTRFPTVPRDGR